MSTHVLLIIRQIHSCSANDFTNFYKFLCDVVCLSVVCYTRVFCVNHSTDLGAIWQIHVAFGPRWGPWPWGEGAIWDQTPTQNMLLQNAAKLPVLYYQLANTNV